MIRFLSKLFFFAGFCLLLFGGYLLWERNDPGRLSFRLTDALKHTKTQPKSDKKPLAILIPTAKIRLPIYAMDIHNGQWPDTKNGVSYLSSSPLPGDKGNSILYGHDWDSLLGRLWEVKPGDEITVLFPSGPKKFTVQFKTTVTPDETHVLSQTADNRITIYTCTGFLDSKRLVVVAELAS